MSSFAADEGHFVADTPVAVLESHLLFSAADKGHLVADAPAVVVKNSLSFCYLLLAMSSV